MPRHQSSLFSYLQFSLLKSPGVGIRPLHPVRHCSTSDLPMISLPFLILLHLLIILSIFQSSLATDILTPEQPISDGETLVSSFQSFELGFFSPRNSKNRYLGIWYRKSPNTVVWVANRNNPITDRSGVLTILDDGNLALFNQTKDIIWSSNISLAILVTENPIAQLLDSGNLVIRSNISTSSESYVWQSFDYPSDTMLPGMKFGRNLRTGLQQYLTSWKSGDDPSPGEFSYKFDIHGLPQIFIYRGSEKRTRTGLWNGLYFGVIPMLSNMVFKPTMVFSDDKIYFTYEPVSNTITMRIMLNQSGWIESFVSNDNTAGWTLLFPFPIDQCDRYSFCGANAMCSVNSIPICECLQGFVPKFRKEWEMNNWTGGCVRSTPLDCQKSEGFVKLEGVKLPDLMEFSLKKGVSLRECEVECAKNCSCTAYANPNATLGSNDCLMWLGDLVDFRSIAQEYKGQQIYVRLQASNIGVDSNGERRRTTIILVSTTTGVVFVSLVFCYAIWKYRVKRSGPLGKYEDIDLPLFDLDTISVATNNFSQENVIGMGGFGPVYKGNLSTGEEIAVKRLSKNSGQGIEEFMNEVDLISKLQHRNLVGLVGCCIQGEERMLMYEYMPNKSLDYYIFDQQRSRLLAWNKRFDIILGITRGLLYLHHDSKLQIVHRDLKASNILLDKNLNPKISDFGLARIFGGDDKDAETKRVIGTYGYMSPEYAIDGRYSMKSDVYSLGVLLLEIVSGRRNRSFSHQDHHHNLLGHAWMLWNEGRALELLDPSLEDSYAKCQVLMCIEVGLLCVQQLPEDRPEISSVALMLASEGAVFSQPKKPGFFVERSSNMDAASTSEECTENMFTITVLKAR